ncbi:MAG: MarP family serine protease [Actinomycetota bacterium]|nr:MarP family serine protease [Actinomycetota bacterium]
MNLFDLLVLLVIAAAAVGGYNVGFVARATGWAGWALGLALGAAFLPPLLANVQGPDPQIRVLFVIGAFLLAASLGATIGEAVGHRLRRLIPFGPLRQADKAAGAVAGGLGVLLLVWLLLPALSAVPGEVSTQVRNSSVARAVDVAAPRAPKPLQTLRQLVTDANFPEVFSGIRPSPGAGTPPADLALSQAVRDRVAASTVKVSGTACGRVMQGSGFSPAPETIVTNAHVVAGVDRPQVRRPDGRVLNATVQVFDPDRDLAVLRVNGLGQAALPVDSATVGDAGAVFGHPGGQNALEVSPARVESRVNAMGRDLYNRTTTRRDIYILASDLAPGDSGGALVDTAGAVVGVAFAIAPDRSSTAYALTHTELAEVLAAPRGGAVDTGPCLR